MESAFLRLHLGAIVAQRFVLIARGGESSAWSEWIVYDRKSGQRTGLWMLPLPQNGESEWREKIENHLIPYLSSGSAVFYGGFELVVEDGFALIVAERPRGYSLQGLVAQQEECVLDDHRVKALAVQICGSLADLHDQGLAHSMICPDRVYVDMDGTPRISGLGVGLIHNALWGIGGGAPEYASFGALEDVRALGGLLFFMLTGRELSTLDNVADGQYPSVAQVRAAAGVSHSVSPIWDTLIKSCLNENPSGRPSSRTILDCLVEKGQTAISPEAAHSKPDPDPTVIHVQRRSPPLPRPRKRRVLMRILPYLPVWFWIASGASVLFWTVLTYFALERWYNSREQRAQKAVVNLSLTGPHDSPHSEPESENLLIPEKRATVPPRPTPNRSNKKSTPKLIPGIKDTNGEPEKSTDAPMLRPEPVLRPEKSTPVAIAETTPQLTEPAVQKAPEKESPARTHGNTFRALTSAELDEIGKKVWKNECGGSLEGLTSWNGGEYFASLGIGHFIWYPKGKKGPFKESFPPLIQYLRDKKVRLPEWLAKAEDCPWRTREEFDAARDSIPMKELRQLLSKTVGLQTMFLVDRLRKSMLDITEGLSADQKEHVIVQQELLCQRKAGIFAMVDYVNFKGEGTDENERYQGKGWGLLQVLQRMDAKDADAAPKAFGKAAEAVLRQRVSLSNKGEEKWLQGWINRVKQY